MNNKRIISALLAASLLTTSAGAVFSDIGDPYTQQAASALAGMGIVSGTGFGQFEPNRVLTRAEFTRIAVGAMGVTNVDNYRSYTIFPDVPAWHWASGWVNAALRHPDLSENPIVRGLGDGSFGPSRPLTLGEASTMVLRMLGYEQADIGPFWPNDYVAKARALGLLNNLSVVDPNAPITRGNAAILFRNTLTAKRKDGSSMLSMFSGGSPVEHSILVATGETDSTLTASQARFYEDGELVVRQVAGAIDSTVVGSQGVVIFDKDRPSHVRGFLPDQSISRDAVIRSVEPEGLDTDMGYVKIPRKTPVVILGEVRTYGEAWFDLTEDTTVSLHYDVNGVLQMISASAAHLSYPTIIVGIDGDEDDIPAGWTIEKNGKEIKASAIDKYDVITLNSSSETALVSDNRITGIYEDASPSFRYPEQITVIGAELPIAEQFASNFKDFSEGERITVLFDAYGRACAAVSARRADAKMEGTMVACDGSTVTIKLTNGVTIKGVCDGELDEDVVGQQVTVEQNSDGTLSLDLRGGSSGSKKKGDWDIAARTLGSARVSSTVQVYERVSSGSPLSPIRISDIAMDVVPSSQIVSTTADSAGVIISIVLKDVTGDSWIYGMVEDATIVTEYEPVYDENGNDITPAPTYDYRVKITTLLNGQSTTREFLLSESSGSLVSRGRLVGLPRAALDNSSRLTLSIQRPSKVDTVGLSDFSGYTMVSTKKGYYPIADDVPVYVEKTGKCITLRQAKANYTEFELYAEKDIDEGGKIRIIVAS